MLEQYYVQYGPRRVLLRAPWIMANGRFPVQLSFGEDVFGGPRWRDLVGARKADEYVASKTVPIMLDPDGRPVKRNFVHVADLTSAILKAIDNPRARQQTFNVCMDEPVDYGELASLSESRGLPSGRVKPRSGRLGSTSQSKFLLGGGPHDLRIMAPSVGPTSVLPTISDQLVSGYSSSLL